MNNRLVINLAIFLLLIFVVLAGVKPAWSTVSDLRSQVVLKKNETENEKQALEKIKSLSGVVDSRQNDVNRLETAIPDSESKPELIAIMENLASQNGLGLTAINIDVVPDEPKSRQEKEGNILANTLIRTLKIDLKLTGSYSSFKSWLEAVENNLRIFDIQKISFSVKENKGSQDQVAVSRIDPVMEYGVTVNTYLLKK